MMVTKKWEQPDSHLLLSFAAGTAHLMPRGTTVPGRRELVDRC